MAETAKLMRILLAASGHSYSTREWAEGYAIALRDAGHEVVGFNYENLIQAYLLALPQWAALFPVFRGLDEDTLHIHACSLAADRLPVAVLEADPDVVLVVNATMYSPKTWDLLDRLPYPAGLILTESPYEDDRQGELAALTNFATTNDRLSISRLREEAGVPIGYLPASYDANVWQPQGVEIQYDWSFVGTKWPERKAHIDAVKGLELNGRCVWAGVEEDGGAVTFLSHPELARLYSATRVNVNMHRSSVWLDGGKVEHEAYSLNPRAYEIAACGAFQVSDPRPELEDVFGDSVPTFESPAELAELVAYWSAPENDVARLKRAQAQHKAVRNHSYRHRADSLVEFIESVLYSAPAVGQVESMEEWRQHG